MTKTVKREEKLSDLSTSAQEDNRACPLPSEWNDLWNLLPNKTRIGVGWNPPLPLILAAWYETSNLSIRQRFIEHIQYAAENNSLDTVDNFLRKPKTEHWHYGR